MKMLNKLIAAGALVLLCSGAQAATINGEISFGVLGQWTGPANANINNATGIDVVNNQAKVETASGDLAVIPNELVNGIGGGAIAVFNDFMFAPANTPITPLWSVLGFSFDLLSITVVSQGNNFLNLTGTGILKNANYDDTHAQWTFTSSDSTGTRLRINNQSTTSVPAPGVLFLLGLGLVGFGVARKMRNA